eukprot:IDg9170t1
MKDAILRRKLTERRRTHILRTDNLQVSNGEWEWKICTPDPVIRCVGHKDGSIAALSRGGWIWYITHEKGLYTEYGSLERHIMFGKGLIRVCDGLALSVGEDGMIVSTSLNNLSVTNAFHLPQKLRSIAS